jgi:hypothetical protein
MNITAGRSTVTGGAPAPSRKGVQNWSVGASCVGKGTGAGVKDG